MIADYPNPMLLEDPTTVSRLDPEAYRAVFIEAVEEALAASERGEVIALEEHQREFYSWFKE